MAVTSRTMSASRRSLSRWWTKIRQTFAPVPVLGWLLGALLAVILEQLIGTQLARLLGMSKVPVLFGYLSLLMRGVGLSPNL